MGGGIRNLTFRVGLLSACTACSSLLLLLAIATVGESTAHFAIGRGVDSPFSCELEGSIASLDGTGVASLPAGDALGKKLAFVVSWRQGSDETFEVELGDDLGAAGEDF